MTEHTTAERIAAIRARLAAVSPTTTMTITAGGSTLRATAATDGADEFHQFTDSFTSLVETASGVTIGPRTVVIADDEDGQDLTFHLHAPGDIAWLLTELEAAQERYRNLAFKLNSGNASDGHHTHNQLYEYRMLYNAHAARGWVAAGYPVVKSWRHSDGQPCFGGGWFVVAAELPTGQVSNHYEADAWDRFDVPEAETSFAWDGHSPADAAERLHAALDEGGHG